MNIFIIGNWHTFKRHSFSKGWLIDSIDDPWQSDLRKILSESLSGYHKIEQINYKGLKAVLYEKK